MFSILIWSWVRGNKIVGEKIKDIDLISLGYSRWQSNALGLCPCSGSFTNQEAVQHGIIFARVSLKYKRKKNEKNSEIAFTPHVSRT